MPNRPLYDVLVADDNELDRRRVEQILVTTGYRVATAEDGTSALDWLRTSPAPSLIILDLMMPGMDGWRFRATQLATPELAEIPVVVLSVIGDAPPHAEALKAASLLSKPVDRAALLAAVACRCD